MNGRSRRVRAKWPMWLVPICSSKPCLVCCCGHAMTPALFSSNEMDLSVAAISLCAAAIEFRSARSSCCTRARERSTPSSDASAARPAFTSREQSTTRHPALSKTATDCKPRPEFPPVTTAVPPRMTYAGRPLARYLARTSLPVDLGPSTTPLAAVRNKATCDTRNQARIMGFFVFLL